jgi:hypothetical protein
MNKQIEALKMAIEALESIELLCDDKRWYLIGNARNACKEALAEAESESSSQPIAWTDLEGNFTVSPNEKFWYPFPLYTHPNQELLNEYWEMGYNQCLETNKKFPIPATWQSLSDEEVNKIADKCYTLQTSVSDYEFNEFEFYRAIEQALKEKNHGN